MRVGFNHTFAITESVIVGRSVAVILNCIIAIYNITEGRGLLFVYYGGISLLNMECVLSRHPYINLFGS